MHTGGHGIGDAWKGGGAVSGFADGGSPLRIKTKGGKTGRAGLAGGRFTATAEPLFHARLTLRRRQGDRPDEENAAGQHFVRVDY